MTYKKQELLTLYVSTCVLAFIPGFGGVRNAHRFSFLCCDVFLFVCRRPVSCMPNVASISGLPVLDFLICCLLVHDLSPGL